MRSRNVPQGSGVKYLGHQLSRKLRNLASFVSDNCDMYETQLVGRFRDHIFSKKSESAGIYQSEIRDFISLCFQLINEAVKQGRAPFSVYESTIDQVSDIYREISVETDDEMYYRRVMTQLVIQQLNFNTENQARFCNKYAGNYALISCDLSGKLTIASFIIKKPERTTLIAEYDSQRILSDKTVHLVRGFIYEDEAEIYAVGNIAGSGKIRLSVLRPYDAGPGQTDFMGMRLAKSWLEKSPGLFPIYCRRIKDPLPLSKTGVATEDKVLRTLKSLGHLRPKSVIEKLWQVVRLSEEKEALWGRLTRADGKPRRPSAPPWSRGVKLDLPE